MCAQKLTRNRKLTNKTTKLDVAIPLLHYHQMATLAGIIPGKVGPRWKR